MLLITLTLDLPITHTLTDFNGTWLARRLLKPSIQWATWHDPFAGQLALLIIRYNNLYYQNVIAIV